MDAISLHDDLARISIGCCISGHTHLLIKSPKEKNEYHHDNESHQKPSKKQQQQPATGRARLASRMASELRRSTKDLKASFTMSLTSRDGSGNNNIKDSHQANHGKRGGPSASEAAQMVAAEYFDQGGSGDVEFDEMCAVPSLMDSHEEDNATIVDMSGMVPKEKEDAATISCMSDTRLSEEDSLALEVGLSAHAYLEECFYTEVSVLDREKFHAIPEIVKSDFTIMGHLGKGSYSDVFEVIVKDGKLVLRTSNSPNGVSHPGNNRRRLPRARRATQEFSSSVTTATLARPQRCDHGSRRVLAMKCLRPQIRSDVDQFTIGAEDLVHETAILANLDHPNIIKLHGRSPGKLTDAFVLNDGYFVLLDKLDETLQDRLDAWKQTPKCMLQGPTNGQVEVARTIAKAMTYLHSKNILFRDLKPDNVGFDANGVLKLFDFGFAVGLPEKDSKNPEGLLYDRCGTPRYMAPEVGLSYGYGLPADVYSFGILLWEICALDKPFSYINSSNEFDRVVFMEHHRPTIDERWPIPLKEIMGRCWSIVPGERPNMPDVELALSTEMTRTDHTGIENVSPKRRVRRSGLIRTRRLSVTGW